MGILLFSLFTHSRANRYITNEIETEIFGNDFSFQLDFNLISRSGRASEVEANRSRANDCLMREPHAGRENNERTCF